MLWWLSLTPPPYHIHIHIHIERTIMVGWFGGWGGKMVQLLSLTLPHRPCIM